VLEAMRGVNAELGVTTLIVTHDPTVSDHVRRTVQIRDGRTSTEVLRRTEVDEHGSERHVAEEFAVLDRVGRLQLPPDFVASLDLRDRVRLALETDHVGVWPDARETDERRQR
jgi:putative ABC transport system ATP-binding protein